MRFIKPLFVLILFYLLIFLVIPLFSYSERNNFLNNEIAGLLNTLPDDNRDTKNKSVSTNELSSLFSYSLAKIAEKNFKTTKYVLEEPKKNIKDFVIIFNQKSASTEFPLKKITSLFLIINNFKLYFIVFFIIKFSFQNVTIFYKTQILSKNNFPFLIPLRI